MAIISVETLLDAGVHFGHKTSRWNPKMAPFIFGRKNLIHIINIRETVRGLVRGYNFFKKLSAKGEKVLFVGTKRQAKEIMKKEAMRCNMYYVSERWLGGILTNFSTIRSRLTRLKELERMEKDGSMDKLSKKRASALKREKKKISSNLEGIRNMNKLPGALLIIDPDYENIALKEAIKLNIPTVCLMDNDSDPDLVDIPIPGNDDSVRSIEVICSKLTDGILEGLKEWEEKERTESRKRQSYNKGRGRQGKGSGEKRKFFKKSGYRKKNYRQDNRQDYRQDNRQDSRQENIKRAEEKPSKQNTEVKEKPINTQPKNQEQKS